MNKAEKRLLFLPPHRPGRMPGQRYRFEQYLPSLEAAGVRCEILPLLDAARDRRFYRVGHWADKALLVGQTFARRLSHALRARRFDGVFLYREAFMLGPPFFEWLLALQNVPLIFDFDDAIWLGDTSAANRRLAFLKFPRKLNYALRRAALVLAGNDYLAEYAGQFSQNVRVMPTTVDTALYRRRKPRAERPFAVIGWSGSPTTAPHFELAAPALRQIKDSFGEQVKFRLIGDPAYRNEALGITGEAWSVENELAALEDFDIGLMPLPDNEWARGKCGLKALTYFAFETPAVVSPVGVNAALLDGGRNGFAAASKEEWISALSRLVEDAILRNELGANARRFVETRYSAAAWAERYAEWVKEALAPRA